MLRKIAIPSFPLVGGVVVIVIAVPEEVSLPPALETVSLAVPDTVYVWVVFLRDDEVVLNQVPSPKLQFHVVGVPEEVSLNLTTRGAVPDVTFVVNDATGAPGADVWFPIAYRLVLPSPPPIYTTPFATAGLEYI